MTDTRTTTRTLTQARPVAHAAFTIMELLVVITIIAILGAILLGGVAIINQGAKESQAQTILTNLIGNAGQYGVKTTKPIQHETSNLYQWGNAKKRNAHGRLNDPDAVIKGDYVNPENTDNPTYSNGVSNNDYMERANLYIERFIWAANQLPAVRDALPSLGGSFADIDDDGFMEVVDPWGNPIAYAANVTHQTGSTANEFLPAHSNPFFASAGKDQMWGLPKTRSEFNSDADWANYQDTDDYKFAQDNLYSFDLDRSQSHR